MKIYCSACGKETPALSMRALCERCQRTPGALKRRLYNWRTGKPRVKAESEAPAL